MVSFWWIIAVALLFVIADVLLFIRFFSGTLRIDRTNPDKEIYRFDVKDLDKLSKKKYVLLSVDNDADLSQK